MKILVINGVNLNMLGVREKEIYGNKDFKSLIKFIKSEAKKLDIKVDCFQSNMEGYICQRIQKARDKYDGIIINAGAYSHTSIAILDSLKCAEIPTVEVHLTDVYSREEFRRHSYVSLYAEKVIVGLGFEGYAKALQYFADKTHF